MHTLHVIVTNAIGSVKEGKRLAAVIKSEARLEQRALEIAIKEMADIQKLQKASIKVQWFLS